MQPVQKSGPSIRLIALTTVTTNLGDECVNRDPPRFIADRQDVDVIRLMNGNPSDSDLSITVFLAPEDAAILFDPAPAAEIELEPGQFVDWTLKANIDGVAGTKFQTHPDICQGQDQDDITIKRGT